MLQMSMHIEIICAGLLWLFQATTEQSIFIGLLLYRLKYPRRIVEPTLKFAAVQSLYVVFETPPLSDSDCCLGKRLQIGVSRVVIGVVGIEAGEISQGL